MSVRQIVVLKELRKPAEALTIQGYADVTHAEDGSSDDATMSSPSDTEALLKAEFVPSERDSTHTVTSPAIQIGAVERIGIAAGARTVARRTSASLKERGSIVRTRIDTAARPILENFATRTNSLSERLQQAIDGPMPLEHPEVLKRLGGALYSETMRRAIAEHKDEALVPLNVRAGIAKMMADGISDAPSAAARVAFPDWNKPLVPPTHRVQPWHPEDAAIWLERFPPNDGLPHPIDTWDDATAALWLNDRDTIFSNPPCVSDVDNAVVPFAPDSTWKPSLEVLHTLGDIELEELTYRVFVERLRREVMSYYVSERRNQIGRMIELITIGYRTLEEARRSILVHDIQRTQHFDEVFGENYEWINDICRRIFALHLWPEGFDEPGLRSDFPDLGDGWKTGLDHHE